MEDLFKIDKDLDIVKDGDIRYLVMNSNDNKFTIDWMHKCFDLLD